jgi:O-antigen/teichoic acid export membrane protein
MDINPVQRQSIIGLGSTVAFTAIGFISTMYFAHAVGPSILGAYFLFLAYFGIFNLITDGGFGGAAVKRISEGKEPNEYFSALMVLRAVLLVITVLGLLIAEPYFRELDTSGLIFWLILALIINVFTSGLWSGIYGAGKVGVYQVSILLNDVARVVTQIIAVFLGFQAAGLAGGFVVGLIVSGLLNLHFLELKLTRFERRHITSLFTFSFWTFLSASGFMVFTYADTVLIGYFMTDADVGIYRVALQLTSLATFVTLALRTTLYPKFSSWSTQGDFASIETALARAITYSLLLAVPVLAGGWIFGEQLLYFLYGASFAAGATALTLLLVVQVAYVFMLLQTSSLNAIDRPRDSFRVTAIAAGVNILLNILLIPIIGIVGAAVATLTTMTLNAWLAHRALSRTIHVRIEYGAVRSILVATLIMSLVSGLYILFVPLSNVFSVLLAVVLGGIVYLLAVLRLDKGINNEIKDLTLQLGLPWPKFISAPE